MDIQGSVCLCEFVCTICGVGIVVAFDFVCCGEDDDVGIFGR